MSEQDLERMAAASTKYSKMFSERKDTFTTGDDAELKIQLTSTAIRLDLPSIQYPQAPALSVLLVQLRTHERRT
jgi:hypothetical protein